MKSISRAGPTSACAGRGRAETDSNHGQHATQWRKQRVASSKRGLTSIGEFIVPKVGIFYAADLPKVRSFDEMAKALCPDCRSDVAFDHSRSHVLLQTPGKLHRGLNVFGPGISPRVTNNVRSQVTMPHTSSVVMNNGMFLGTSMIAMDANHRLFGDGVRSLSEPRIIGTYDPNFTIDADGDLFLKEASAENATRSDYIAVPVCGPGFANYGHFLFDGLPAAFVHTQMIS